MGGSPAFALTVLKSGNGRLATRSTLPPVARNSSHHVGAAGGPPLQDSSPAPTRLMARNLGAPTLVKPMEMVPREW